MAVKVVSHVLLNVCQTPIDRSKECKRDTCILHILSILLKKKLLPALLPVRADTRSGCVVCEAARRHCESEWVPRMPSVDAGPSVMLDLAIYPANDFVPPLYVTKGNKANFEIIYGEFKEDTLLDIRHRPFKEYEQARAMAMSLLQNVDDNDFREQFGAPPLEAVVVVFENTGSINLVIPSMAAFPPIQYWYAVYAPTISRLMPKISARNHSQLSTLFQIDRENIHRIGELLRIESTFVAFFPSIVDFNQVRDLIAETGLQKTTHVKSHQTIRKLLEDLILTKNCIPRGSFEELFVNALTQYDMLPVMSYRPHTDQLDISIVSKPYFLWAIYFLLVKNARYNSVDIFDMEYLSSLVKITVDIPPPYTHSNSGPDF